MPREMALPLPARILISALLGFLVVPASALAVKCGSDRCRTFDGASGAGAAMTSGPDGAVWFAGDGFVGRLTPGGEVKKFSAPTTSSSDVEAGPDGGILTGEAIAGLQLEKLKLVVLSACETGLGANTDTEGVRGLQRAFHLAGCPDVVASLWEVNDEATAALMNCSAYARALIMSPASNAIWASHVSEAPMANARSASAKASFASRAGSLLRIALWLCR